MARVNISPDLVLTAVATRLETALALGDRRVRLSVDGSPPKIPMGVTASGYYLVVSMGGITFDPAMQFGGGVDQVEAVAQVSVTAITRVALDDPGGDDQLLVHSSRGLYAIARSVVKALTQQDLPHPTSGSDTFLREWATVTNIDSPQVGHLTPTQGAAIPAAWITVTFSAAFDWDMSS